VPEAQRNPALDALDALVGEWTMAAGPPGGPAWEGDVLAIAGQWEITSDGSTWDIDFNVTYTRID
jgi:hypothetical protein